jgi:thioredoxin reductase
VIKAIWPHTVSAVYWATTAVRPPSCTRWAYGSCRRIPASRCGHVDRARLAAAQVPVNERPVAELAASDGELEAVVFSDGSRLARRGLLVATTLHQRSRLAEQLGAGFGEPTPSAENPVGVDALYRTTAPGVFAAGDVSAQLPQVAAAVAAGSLAATAVVQSLLADDYGLAVTEGRRHVNA